MYRKVQQLSFGDFVFPYGELDQENAWVNLAAIVPWDVAERKYGKQLPESPWEPASSSNA